MIRAKWFGVACVLAFSQMLTGCGGGGGTSGNGVNNTNSNIPASGVATANVVVTTVIATQQ